MGHDRRILKLERDIAFLPVPNEVATVLTGALPPPEQITAAFILAFDCDRLLMTRLRDPQRGWDIPGGRIEPGETPEQAARRETREETGARLGPAHPFAYQRVRLLGPRPEGYRFPYPDSYMVFFRASIAALDPFEPNDEAEGNGLLPPAEARRTRWGSLNCALYEAALQDASRSSAANRTLFDSG